MPNPRQHTYETEVVWTGNLGTGTDAYRSYNRTNDVTTPGAPTIPGSSDPHFRGDDDRWNPEQLLLASLSQCHMLSYLHVCTANGVVVTAYTDHATGVMELTGGGSGHFTSAQLHPQVTVASADMAEKAQALHHEAHRVCFIANSVAFPVEFEGTVVVADSTAS